MRRLIQRKRGNSPRFSSHPNPIIFAPPQALRHLYALATVERSVECVDVITGNPVFVPVAFKEGGQEKKAMSPLLLKEGVEDLRLDTDRYYQVKFGGPGGVDALLRGGGGGPSM